MSAWLSWFLLLLRGLGFGLGDLSLSAFGLVRDAVVDGVEIAFLICVGRGRLGMLGESSLESSPRIFESECLRAWRNGLPPLPSCSPETVSDGWLLELVL